MSRQQTYIVRLLRQVEASASGNGARPAQNFLSAIIQKISQADNVHDALEMLYGVPGFEDFAIRLMWCLERNGVVYSDPEDDLLEYEVGNLTAALHSSSKNVVTHIAPVEIPAQPLGDFYDTLHNFGRSIEEVKRRFLQGDGSRDVDSEILYRIMSNLEDLKKTSKKVAKEPVCRFAESAVIFLQYVVDHHTSADRRVVYILDHANRTLQTVMETVGIEEYQSLNEVSAMLNVPEQLLS